MGKKGTFSSFPGTHVFQGELYKMKVIYLECYKVLTELCLFMYCLSLPLFHCSLIVNMTKSKTYFFIVCIKLPAQESLNNIPHVGKNLWGNL